MAPVWTCTTASPEATEALGRALIGLLPPGSVVALYGDLATGKTCLVRGMSQTLNHAGNVHSPTFTLVNEYEDGLLTHLDLYRLSGPEEVYDLGYEEIFEPSGICVVEWAERAGTLLPPRHVSVRLAHAGGDRRTIAIDDRGLLPPGWQDTLARAVPLET
ncbi:MAG: tRNA (adenosine(37)-N6)-threonylcarbamoyltransferase complex ATPase subunit type 1 TsaE [Candidatus Hydrogenedentes bacterium]|nr:tRNA (adenosine(37)-N6)-threonylcarbamoyltransferase complex ATPase subunit type 1 TsaE [Candidatus Hydrogenedentota bacterium]